MKRNETNTDEYLALWCGHRVAACFSMKNGFLRGSQSNILAVSNEIGIISPAIWTISAWTVSMAPRNSFIFSISELPPSSAWTLRFCADSGACSSLSVSSTGDGMMKDGHSAIKGGRLFHQFRVARAGLAPRGVTRRYRALVPESESKHDMCIEKIQKKHPWPWIANVRRLKKDSRSRNGRQPPWTVGGVRNRDS